MLKTVNAGARLDRLPLSSFHTRIFWLIGAGMFFDGYDLYVGTAVLPVLLQEKFSTFPLNGWFVSLTFLGINAFWEKAIQGAIILSAIILERMAARHAS